MSPEGLRPVLGKVMACQWSPKHQVLGTLQQLMMSFSDSSMDESMAVFVVILHHAICQYFGNSSKCQGAVDDELDVQHL